MERVSPLSWQRSAALLPLSLTLLVALAIDFSTDTPTFGPFYGMWPAGQASSAWTACAIVVLAGAFLLPPRALPSSASEAWSPRVALTLRLAPACAALAAYSWTAPFVSLPAGVRWDVFVGVSLSAFLLLAVRALRRAPAWPVIALAAVSGTVVRAVHFERFTFRHGADMLPLVTSAVDALLAGHSPYAWYELPGRLPLTYYPLTMLAYLPARALHFDPRWTNVGGELAVLAALLWAGRPKLERGAGSRSELAQLGWAAIYMLPSSVYFDRITTAPVAWAALAWLMVLTGRGSRHTWLALGLALASTPLALVLAPFVALSQRAQLGLPGAARSLAAALALALALTLPWALWAPEAFFEGTVLWFNDLSQFPGTVWRDHRTWERYVGLGGLFWDTGHERWLKPIQAFCVLLLAGSYAWRRESSLRAPAYAGAALALFMAFNSVHWPYFYQPVLVAGLVYAALLDGRAASPVPLHPTPLPP